MQCLGIIMDGNRRWAAEKQLPKITGHEAGYKKLIEVLNWARDAKITHIIAYAFSTENWNRSAKEVSFLMKLFEKGIKERLQKIAEEKVRIIFIGDRGRFPERLKKLMKELEEKTASHRRLTLGIAVSYGGRAEIISAVRRLPHNVIANLSEKKFSQCLWTRDFPDPELIIRTGGQKRLSNFLLWQAAYSELYFTDALWPAFSKKEFLSALKFFAKTKRNFGK